jgi:DNA-binding Xre family transcriptional regulator/Holliday junction resolvase-like predicted endonuclease
MDLVRLGRVVRALRIRRRWRQVDLAQRSGFSQALVARVERGGADRLTLATLQAITRQLGARLIVRIDWNGEAGDRLLDADHAAIVDRVLGFMRSAGWVCVPELTFAVYGERGSIDILAWHDATRTLLVVEVKTVVPDIQGTLSTLDRKERLAARLAADRGWRSDRVAVLLVVAASATSRRRVAEHEATFRARLPDRSRAARRFIAQPGAMAPVRGIWFLSVSTGASSRERVVRPRRAA